MYSGSCLFSLKSAPTSPGSCCHAHTWHFLCSNLLCSQHKLHLSPPFLICSQLYLMSGTNCFLLKYDLSFTPCCYAFTLLLHINMLQILPSSPPDLGICAPLSISSTYRCFFLRLWLHYVFSLLKAHLFLDLDFPWRPTLHSQLLAEFSTKMLPESSKSHFWKPNSLCLLPHQTSPTPCPSSSDPYLNHTKSCQVISEELWYQSSLSLSTLTSPNSTGHKDHVHSLTKMS